MFQLTRTVSDRCYLKQLSRSAIGAGFGLFLSAILSAITAQAAPPVAEVLAMPAGVHTRLSRVTADEAGRIYLSWVAESGAEASLLFATLEETGWSKPELIARGDDWFLNWTDFPMLSVHRGQKLAHWLRRSAQGTYDYDVVISAFDPATQAWSTPRVLHTDAISAEHGFVSMLPLGEGRMLINWLDGRQTRDPSGEGAMTLRSAVTDASGHTLEEWELDSRVCDCCQTSTAMTAEGPVVVYRDRSAGEVRDTAISRYVMGAWTSPQTVHDDAWTINGCPTNGPAVAARDTALAVAWFTGADETARVKLALSSDSGKSFEAPVIVAEEDTLGRLGAVILASGDIVVSSLRGTDSTATISLTRFKATGEFVEETKVAATSPSRRSGFPAIAAVGNAVYVTWTNATSDGQSPGVNLARVTYE